MRPTQSTALRELEDAVERDGVPQLVQLLDHQLDAPSAILPKPPQARLQRLVGWIDEVPEDVRVSPLRLGVQLGRWDDADTERIAGGDGLGHTGQGVVIGE